MEKAERLVEELIDIWENAENYTKAEVLDTLENMGESIKLLGHRLGRDWLEYIKTLKVNESICPECGETLTYRSYDEIVGEAWGRPVTQQIAKLGCEGCGFSYDE